MKEEAGILRIVRGGENGGNVFLQKRKNLHKGRMVDR
jgi:hypothetical protein